jgi:DNA replication factor GINS
LYDELFEAWRKEKENVEFQTLPSEFYLRLADYIKKIHEEKRMLDEKTIKGQLLQREEENVLKMTEELIQTRCEKLTHLIASGESVPSTNLTEEENTFCKEASSQADYQRTFVKNILQGRLLKEKKSKPKNQMIVRILQQIPQIMGTDMKTYGPFKPEDIATLPEENAKTLIKQKAATEIET